MSRRLAFGSSKYLTDSLSTIANAAKQLDAYVSGNFHMHHSLLHVILTVSSANGDYSTYQKIKLIYLSAPSTSIDLKETCLRALASTRSRRGLEDYLELLLSDDVQVSDLQISALALSAGSISRLQFWNWLQKRWDDLIEKFDGSWHNLDRFLRAGLGGFSESGVEEEVKTFFAKKDCESLGFARGLDVITEKIRVNTSFRIREEAALKQFLERSQE